MYASTNVPATLGTSALVSDCEGNRIGLIEVEEHAHVMFKMGKFAHVRTPFHEAVQAAAKSLESAYESRANKR
jgi:hypothetical protein